MGKCRTVSNKVRKLKISNTVQMKKIKEELKQFSQKSKKSQSKLTDKLRELEINVDLLESERDALDKYFEFLKDIEKKQHIRVKKGKVVRGYKIKDDHWGGLLIDVPRLLNSFEVNAFREGKLIYEAQGDQSTVDLLTKRFNPKKSYSLNSVKNFFRPQSFRHARKVKKIEKNKFVGSGVVY